MELGLDPGGVGLVEFGEDVDGLPPGALGRIRVASGEVGVAEMGERFRFVVPVTGFSAPRGCFRIAGDRAVVVAKLLVDEAEGVQCLGLAMGIVDLPIQCQRLLGVRLTLPWIAVLGVEPGDVVERPSLPTSMACRAEQRERERDVFQ